MGDSRWPTLDDWSTFRPAHPHVMIRGKWVWLSTMPLSCPRCATPVVALRVRVDGFEHELPAAVRLAAGDDP